MAAMPLCLSAAAGPLLSKSNCARGPDIRRVLRINQSQCGNGGNNCLCSYEEFRDSP